ncbi:type IV conjugative transfer system protein TraL [Vibrio echinoideorum]|uniref:type IV conjugative transfer system protein TraL n=1 Tax=Vibrio echinoideorum TaxID=2100116 RepID=UPI00354B7174
MEQPEQYYLIPSSFDNGAVFMGLPREESLPAIIILAIGIMLKHEMIGIALAMACLFVVRYVKGQYGINVFNRSRYYYMSTSKHKASFKRLPASSLRYWLP